MATPAPTPFLYTTFYDPDEGVHRLPQLVQGLVTIEPRRGRGIAYRPGRAVIHVSRPMGHPVPVPPEWLYIPYINIVPAKDTSYTPHVIPKTDKIRLGDSVTEKDRRQSAYCTLAADEGTITLF